MKKPYSINPSDNTLKILLVEDNVDMNRELTNFLKRSFPNAEIRSLQHFFEEDDVEDLIKKESYTLAFLDASLNNWIPHTKFDTWGGNLIPVFKTYSPATIVISISSEERYNDKMIEQGADLAIKKILFQREKKFAPDLTVIDA